MKATQPHRQGFTLIELLVVMTIIAILAAGLFTVAQSALRKARIVQAQNITVGLATGINNFRTDYSRWPYPEGDKVEQHQSDSAFMINLIGIDTTLNKRGRNYVDNLPQAKGAPPSNGIVYSGDSGDVFDPWQNYFDIYIDHDGDGQVTNPEGGDALRMKIVVVSGGPDMTLSGTNEDGKDATLDNAKSY